MKVPAFNAITNVDSASNAANPSITWVAPYDCLLTGSYANYYGSAGSTDVMPASTWTTVLGNSALYLNGEKIPFMILHSRYCEANTNVLTLLKGEWPKMVYCPKGTTVEWKNIFSSGKNQLRLHIVPLKEMWGGVKTLIRRIANATFKGGLRDATREENVARGGRQHIDGSLRSTSLVSNRIRSVHPRRRANYHTYKPYHSQCADIRNVHSEIPEVHVEDGRQNRREIFLIRPLFRCGTGEKYLGGNGPSGSGVRGIAVASGMNLRGLRLKEAA